MINFIICDDNASFLKKEKRIVDNFMMRYDLEYKTYLYSEYNSSFDNILTKDIGFKIFLLDIQTKNASGLDIARKIREEYDDWVSVIIIVTAFNEFKYEALSNRLYLLDFINKMNKCDEKLVEDLEISLKHYSNRGKSLKYEYNHIIRQVEFRHIIYIEKIADSKKCIIKTTYGEQIINKTLSEVTKMLDKRFIKTSRSMIVNVDFIREYNVRENKIIFTNGEYTYQISRSMKKGVKKYVSEYN